MLLLKKPMRLSTDIDIVVEPGTDIDAYIEEAGKLFPFIRVEEQKRIGRNDIVKRHFKFVYLSPTSGNEVTILLDVLFEENHYASLVERNIENELLLVEKPDITVKIPNVIVFWEISSQHLHHIQQESPLVYRKSLRL